MSTLSRRSPGLGRRRGRAFDPRSGGRRLASLWLLVPCLLAPPGVQGADDVPAAWQVLETRDGSRPSPRHEAGAVVVGDTLHLLGGRGRPPHESYSAEEGGWRDLGPLPLELNHFQPVVLAGKIVVVGAFTGNYPREESVAAMHAHDLATGTWDVIGTMPAARVRGSTAAIVREGRLYVIGGNTRGHDGGAVPWFDEYDPATGRWTTLPDAPHARDHFTAALVGDRLIAAGGRRSMQPNPAANPVLPTDVYDFASGEWRTVAAIPTPRAGTMTVAAGGEVIVVGGEINTSPNALDTVEAFDPVGGTWRSLPALGTGRHGAGIALIGDTLHVVAGASSLGGATETRLHETLALDPGEVATAPDTAPESPPGEPLDPETVPPEPEDTGRGTDGGTDGGGDGPDVSSGGGSSSRAGGGGAGGLLLTLSLLIVRARRTGADVDSSR